jgi:hypothetical protein
MAGSTHRLLALVGASLAVLAPGALTGQEGPPSRSGAAREQELVVIPRDWRETYPFSARFPDTEGAEHVIDLAAVRFATDRLVTLSGRKTFREPELPGSLTSQVRQPFSSRERDLFIVQATDPKAQATLRRWLERAGIPILGYIPHDAYLVRLDRRVLSLVSGQDSVFWVGLYQPAYRVAPDVDFILEADPSHRLRLRLRLDPEVLPSEAAVREALGAVPGAEVVEVARTRRDWVARVDGPVTLARTFAALPGCLWVERYLGVRLHNNVARTSGSVATGRGAEAGPIMDVEDVWSRGIRGEGQIAAAADTGLSTGDKDTPDNFHFDFGQAGSATNPMRVKQGYALWRTTWSDDQSIGGGHGTHVAGSIVGNGIRSGSDPSTDTFPASSYAGIAPKAQFVFQSLMLNTGGIATPGDLNALFLPPYNDGARVHSNSWGSEEDTGAYDSASQDVDEFVQNHKDMVITFSAGNSGSDGIAYDQALGQCVSTGNPVDGVVDADSIGSPATAKNGITVGASENYRPDFVYQTSLGGTCNPAGGFAQRAWGWPWNWCFTEDPIYGDKFADNAAGLAAFSSRGPTDDGRIKPDLVAPGTAITSTRTDVNQAYEAWGECEIPPAYQGYYVNMGGTSMSNPLTAGAATLVRQYYADGWHGKNSEVTESAPVPSQGFSPSAALVKATLINGAWDMAPGQYGVSSPQPEIPSSSDRGNGLDLPNNAEGFGRVDLETSLFPHAGWGRDPRRRMAVREQDVPVTTGGYLTFPPYHVGSSNDPLIVTLVWTDPYADLAAGPKLVNDVDLEVTSPSGRRYTPNRVDDYVTAPTDFKRDSVNNVEQVKVTRPETGTWTVTVRGTNVPGNGVSGSELQFFAFVFSGVLCGGGAAPTGVTAQVNGNNRIDVSWDSVAGAAEYHVYRGVGSEEPTTLVATVAAPGTSFVDTDVAGGLQYSYLVKWAAFTCESTASAVVTETATGVCSLPPQFGGLVSVSGGSGTCALTLSWDPASAPCGGPASYSVYRSTASPVDPVVANRIATGVTAMSFEDSGALQSGMAYHYVVRATDEGNGVQETNTVERSGTATGTTTTVYRYGPQSFDALANGSMAGWLTGAFTGDALDWRGVRTCTAHSGGKIFRFGGTACDASYGQGKHSLATPGLTSVPAGDTDVRLSFWHRWNFDPGKDGAYLRVSLDGSTWNYVPPAAFLSNGYTGTVGGLSMWTGDFASFENTVVDLDAVCNLVAGSGCAGKSFYVAFVGWTDANATTHPGWFIDDVEITADVTGSCSVAPEPVPFFTARSTSLTNLLEWRNPAAGGYASAVVRVGTSGFPATVDEGAAVDCPGQNTALGAYNSCTHSDGVVNGTTYYYSLFVSNGGGLYSSRRTVKATPFDTSGARKWSYSTGATSLAPAGILPGPLGEGAVFAFSNDRILHGMNPTAGGGSWPRTAPFAWTPVAMNGPAQHRPPVVSLAAGPRVFLASQDGYAYAVDAADGALVWTSDPLGDVLQASPAGFFSELKPGAPDILFVGTRNATKPNKLIALDPANGATLAEFDNGGGGAIGIITGITVDYLTYNVYFTSRASGSGSSHTLWCVHASRTDGSPTASLDWVSSLPVGDIDGSPVLYQTRVYVGTNAGVVKAIDVTNPAAPAEVWTYGAADGPIKGYVFPRFGSSPVRLYFATNTRVWAVDYGATISAWSTPLANPSTPLYVVGTNDLLVGSGNTLYQLNAVNGAVVGSVGLGSTLGSPARDAVNEVFHVGSTAGVLHAVTLPLP